MKIEIRVLKDDDTLVSINTTYEVGGIVRDYRPPIWIDDERVLIGWEFKPQIVWMTHVDT